MKPTFRDDSVTFYNAEAIAALKTLPEECVDSCVTDPPYDLTAASRNGSSRVPGTGPFGRHRIGTKKGKGFMGKDWDGTGIAFRPATWEAVKRVMKPGAYLLAFGGPRTFHRMSCAIEDAGFVLQDVLCWLFGQGFPKHKSKLKPAWEPIVMAWKPNERATPLPGLDACRIGFASDDDMQAAAAAAQRSCRDQNKNRVAYGDFENGDASLQPYLENIHKGRWPANVVLSHHEECVCVGTKKIKSNSHHPAKRGKGGNGTAGHKGQDDLAERRGDEEAEAWQCHQDCPVRLLDEQSGELTSGTNAVRSREGYFGDHGGLGKAGDVQTTYGDAGGASRFFYASKAQTRDREAGLDAHEAKLFGISGAAAAAAAAAAAKGVPYDNGDGGMNQTKMRKNVHPTVKPIDLMRWLCRLITPPQGTVLDCFMGSGTTGVAALEERMKFIGIEQDAEYFEIAKKRITSPMGPLFA